MGVTLGIRILDRCAHDNRGCYVSLLQLGCHVSHCYAAVHVVGRVVGALVSGCVARRAKSYVGEGFTSSRLARQGLTT